MIDSCNCILSLSVFSLCMFDYFIEDIGVSFETKTTFFMAVLRDGDGTWKKNCSCSLEILYFYGCCCCWWQNLHARFVRHSVWSEKKCTLIIQDFLLQYIFEFYTNYLYIEKLFFTLSGQLQQWNIRSTTLQQSF